MLTIESYLNLRNDRDELVAIKTEAMCGDLILTTMESAETLGLDTSNCFTLQDFYSVLSIRDEETGNYSFVNTEADFLDYEGEPAVAFPYLETAFRSRLMNA